LATSAEPTDNDIIDAVLQKEDSDWPRQWWIHWRNSARETVSNLFTSPGCCANVNELFENSETVDDSTLNARSVIKRNLRDIKVKSMKQISILNYISIKQGNN
jgi:hypothetical protein